MKLEQRQDQKLEQTLTQEQRQLLETAKKSIGYIEACIRERTYWEYENGEVVKKIHDINGKVDDSVPDVYEFMSRHTKGIE